MKLLYFDEFTLGVLKGENVVDVSAVVQDIPHTGPHDLITGLIERFEDYRDKLQAAADAADGVPVSSVRIRPPLPKPYNIDCMAGNYMEDGTRDAPRPINAFHKSSSGIIGDGDTMVLTDTPATIFEGEAEIGIVIGKTATAVSEADAMDYVFGYINFIDGSARAVGPTTNSFYQSKSRETFAPIGPYLVTKDEIPDPHNLHIQLWNNGEIRQDYHTSDMAHKIPQVIAFVTDCHTMGPGDFVGAGTNHRGLHAFQDGDKIELEVENLGRLHINVRDDLKRVWSRETRLQRQEAGHKAVHAPQLSGKYAPEDA